MKIVCDTNVLVSALVFPGGPPDEILQLARSGLLTLHLSPDIVTETKRVLMGKFQYTEEQAGHLIERFTAIGHMVYPTERVQIIQRVEADNRILECALTAQADFLVTGDRRDILPLRKIGGTPIVSPREFLDILRSTRAK